MPAVPGVYSWWFTSLPPRVEATSCVTALGATLLYVGISPKAPPKNGRPPSRQTMQSRVRYHYRGNAEGSTLRLTLGCLLAPELGFALRRVGSGKRFTFTIEGEAVLSDWMAENAHVAWQATPEPWVLEAEAIHGVALPLNLDQNKHHPFHPVLSQVRRDAKAAAVNLPVVPR